MMIHATVVTCFQFADWNGKAAARLDLRSKNAKGPNSNYHLYCSADSSLAKLQPGDPVKIDFPKPKK